MPPKNNNTLLTSIKEEKKWDQVVKKRRKSLIADTIFLQELLCDSQYYEYRYRCAAHSVSLLVKNICEIGHVFEALEQ